MLLRCTHKGAMQAFGSRRLKHNFTDPSAVLKFGDARLADIKVSPRGYKQDDRLLYLSTLDPRPEQGQALVDDNKVSVGLLRFEHTNAPPLGEVSSGDGFEES